MRLYMITETYKLVTLRPLFTDSRIDNKNLGLAKGLATLAGLTVSTLCRVTGVWISCFRLKKKSLLLKSHTEDYGGTTLTGDLLNI